VPESLRPLVEHVRSALENLLGRKPGPRGMFGSSE
jgi:hypothetical protein